jgi:hypothetical protein
LIIWSWLVVAVVEVLVAAVEQVDLELAQARL